MDETMPAAAGVPQSDATTVCLARGVRIPRASNGNLLAECAALLAVGPADAAVSGFTAARLRGLWLPSASAAHPDGSNGSGVQRWEIATADPERPSRRLNRTHRSQIRASRRRLRRSDVGYVDGLPVLTAARVWVDLASRLSMPDLVALGDSALRSGTSPQELDEVIAASAGARGIVRARAARDLLDERSRSRPESHLRVAISAPDLPRFAVNQPVHRRHGGWLAEPDLSLSEARLALEYQGEHHARVDRMRRDITRSTDLRSEGWTVLEYGPAEVFGRPWLIAPELRRLIRIRAPNLLR